MPEPILMTKSEAEVVSMLFGGKTQKQIAEDLGKSLMVVNKHICNVYKKAGVSSPIELVARAMKTGGYLF